MTNPTPMLTDEMIKDNANEEYPPHLNTSGVYEKYLGCIHGQQIARSFYEKEIEGMKKEINICDICGNHPSVILLTPQGRFCETHVKY